MPIQHIEFAAWRALEAPMGTYLLGLDRQGATRAQWAELQDHPWPPQDQYDPSCCQPIAEVLQHYFQGHGIDPAQCMTCMLPEAPPFYAACWNACRMIPLGHTINYSQLARNAGNSKAIRAAAGSMRANTAPLLVPCHRVISANGSVGGFAGAVDPTSVEVQLKIQLLEFEIVCISTPIKPDRNRAINRESAVCA
jgi:O-6-methylguanine DNA methyltransferase